MGMNAATVGAISPIGSRQLKWLVALDAVQRRKSRKLGPAFHAPIIVTPLTPTALAAHRNGLSPVSEVVHDSAAISTAPRKPPGLLFEGRNERVVKLVRETPEASRATPVGEPNGNRAKRASALGTGRLNHDKSVTPVARQKLGDKKRKYPANHHFMDGGGRSWNSPIRPISCLDSFRRQKGEARVGRGPRKPSNTERSCLGQSGTHGRQLALDDGLLARPCSRRLHAELASNNGKYAWLSVVSIGRQAYTPSRVLQPRITAHLSRRRSHSARKKPVPGERMLSTQDLSVARCASWMS
jgi:hypothetical protein